MPGGREPGAGSGAASHAASGAEPDEVGIDGGPSGRWGPHAFVDDLRSPGLSDDDLHHLARVVRLRAGDPLTVSDAEGSWRAGRFTCDNKVEPAGPIHHVPQPSPEVTVGFALVKGDRPEWVVRKLTEVGVDRICPFVADRSIVRWDAAKGQRQVERWRRVAREAAMQCRRCRLPAVHEITTFDQVVAGPGDESGALRSWALADRRDGAAPLSPDHPAVLVGPEGGWSEAELARGLPAVLLGPHVLRAETAAVAAGALLVAQRPPAGRGQLAFDHGEGYRGFAHYRQ